LLKARELIEAQETTAFEPDVGRWLAQVYLTEGDIGRAEAEIQALLAPGTKLGIEAEPIHRLRGQILAAQGKLAEAAQVLQESLKRLEQDQAVYEMACTLLALAEVLAQMEGKAPEARTCAERAQKTFADLSAKLDLQEADKLIAQL
jgi:tetratricopeptide (TPR) repeat protein